MRLDRPVGTLLLLWPAMWALVIAGEGRPDPFLVAAFVLGVFLMRSAGCVINDYADRDFDPHVKRTAERPLATGAVSPREALALFCALGLAAFSLVLLMSPLTRLLSVPAILLAASYPFMKRYTYLPQVHLGVAFGWAVPMGFAAQTGTVPLVAWLLLCAVVLWAVAYDTMYAMVDRDDDLRIGLKSTAILFGEGDRLWIGVSQAMVLVVLALVGNRLELGLAYHLGLAAGASLMGYQQYLIRHREPAACFRAFQNNNWLGAAVLVALIAEYAAGA